MKNQAAEVESRASSFGMFVCLFVSGKESDMGPELYEMYSKEERFTVRHLRTEVLDYAYIRGRPFLFCLRTQENVFSLATTRLGLYLQANAPDQRRVLSCIGQIENSLLDGSTKNKQ